jgi:hypothetical protein
LRFRGEGGLHEIKALDPTDGTNPDVVVRLSGEGLAAYRPPETVVRRGWYRDEPARRQYDLIKGSAHDGAVERVWSNVIGGLPQMVAEALTANVRARLLKMIVE